MVGRTLFAAVLIGALAAGPATKPAPATQPAVRRPIKVVYVLDATGSMLGKWDEARTQVRQALDMLKPTDSFDVVTVQDEKAKVFAAKLVQASPQKIEEVNAFIDAAFASGPGEVTAGVLAAFKLQPQVIWVVSDGDSGEPGKMLREVRAANAAHIPINTFSRYTYDDPRRLDILCTLAAQNGGVCFDAEGKPQVNPLAKPPMTQKSK